VFSYLGVTKSVLLPYSAALEYSEEKLVVSTPVYHQPQTDEEHGGPQAGLGIYHDIAVRL
jgi:hypothetical protein